MTASGGAGSTAQWNKMVTINKAVITTASTGTNTPPAADSTANAAGIDGVLSWCELSTVLGNAIPQKCPLYDNAGAGLTTLDGGIAQFDEILAYDWETLKTAPSVMLMSARMNKALVGKLQALGSGNGPSPRLWGKPFLTKILPWF
jgi:hypothetical protein